MKRNFTIEDAVDMICQKSRLGMTEKQATIAFSYSKMVIIDEIEQANIIDKLNFTEF